MKVVVELLTPANLLTLLRLPLALLVWPASHSPLLWFSVVVIAGLTDLLDGRLARRTGTDARALGALLDPLCDKVFIVSACASAVVAFGVPWLMLLLICARELILAPATLLHWAVPSLHARHIDVRAAPIGKIATGLQIAALIHAAIQPSSAAVTVAAAAVAGVVAAVHYVHRALRARPARAPAA